FSVRITLGENRSWRAASIDIGNNLFNLQQTQSTAPKKVGNILMIKNSTALDISVYFKIEPGQHGLHLGSIDANSQKSFTNIPERGRWYYSIYPSPGTYSNSHDFTLYVKENQYVYYYEVKPEHFR
ncbi:hypothetical protein ACFLT2_14200, partial [Acidobacteriota bacterium]